MPPGIGGLLVAAGATFGSAMVTGAVSAGTAAILAGISFGAGMIRRYVFNRRPDQEGIRGNVASGEATLPICYGLTDLEGDLHVR